MLIRNTFQSSLLSIGFSAKKLRCEKFLEEMDRVIPWDSFLSLILPHYEEKKTGRPKTDALLLLRIYFLQQWYDLSDPMMEEWIYDRISFQKFLGIDLLSIPVPDETTILHFRRLLETHGIQKEFFSTVRDLLEGKGLLLKEGSIVDATIIAAPSSTKNSKKERDPEMKSTKKGSNYSFGMKAHIGVDSESGLVHSLETTSANVHDSDKFEECLHGKEKTLFADKGYFKGDRKKEARAKGIFCGILDKAKRGSRLSMKQKYRNKKLSSVRAKVEHPFQVLKCQWGFEKVRYRWLEKNSLRLHAVFALINLFKVRKKLPNLLPAIAPA